MLTSARLPRFTVPLYLPGADSKTYAELYQHARDMGGDRDDDDEDSNNEESVMYWAVESADLSNIITGQLPDDFDNDDRNDLAGMLSGDIPVRDQLWLP